MEKYNNRMNKILLVEDDPDDVDLIRRAIASNGLEVELDVVDNGEDALKYLRQQDEFAQKTLPDITLLDLNLPRVSGKQILHTVRQNSDLQHLVMIVLSTSSAQDDIDQCYFLNANCFVSKPMTIQGYIEVIKGIHGFWLGTKRLPSSSMINEGS